MILILSSYTEITRSRKPVSLSCSDKDLVTIDTKEINFLK